MNKRLDWFKVNGATGPIFINGAKPGDTLVVNIQEIRVAEKGVIAVIPKQGALKDKSFKAIVKVVSIHNGYICFESGIKPMRG